MKNELHQIQNIKNEKEVKNHDYVRNDEKHESNPRIK